MKRRFIVAIITVILFTSIFAGCKTKVTGKPTPTQTIDILKDYKFNLPDASEYDFGGKTFTIYSHYGGGYAQREDTMRRFALDEYIMDLYNVKIQYTLDLAECEAAAIAGVPIADLAYLMPHQVAQWINGGIAEPMQDYAAELKLDDARWDQTLLDWMNINGKQYAVGTKPKELWKYHYVYALFMNKDLLKSCNIDPNDIYEKQKNKQWNWDEFAQTASKITRDINGDEIVDVYGVTVGGSQLFDSFMISNQTNIVQNTQSGFTFKADNKVIDVMNYLNSLIRTGASRQTETVSGISAIQDDSDFINGKIGFNVQVFQRTWVTLTAMDNEYGVLCIPMAPTATDYYLTDSMYAVMAMFAQPDKARARELVEFLYLYDTSLYESDEDERECYWLEANNRIYDEGSKYFLERVYERTNVVLINNILYTYNGLPFSPEALYAGEKTAKQIIEECTPKCEEFMKTYLKN